MITAKFKRWFDQVFTPAGAWLVKRGLTPNQITVLGLGLGVLCCLIYVWTRATALFCVLITAAGLFDALDGVAARLSNRVTKFGSYLDAVCDRLFEGAVTVAVAVVTGYWFLAMAFLIGSFAVSYAKARAAMEVNVSNAEWPDMMERTERGALFVLGLFISEITGIFLWQRPLFFWVLAALNILTYATVIQRIVRAKSLIETRSGGGSN